jgi:hypothetical protein
MLRLIDVGTILPNNYPVISVNNCKEFRAGQIAMFIRENHGCESLKNRIRCGPSDGSHFIGIIDDERSSDIIPIDTTATTGKITVWPNEPGLIFETDQFENDIQSVLSNNQACSAILKSSQELRLFVSENAKLTLRKDEPFCKPFAKLVDYKKEKIIVEVI